MITNPVVVPFGNVHTYAQLTCDYAGGNGPRLRYILEIHDGIARCVHADLNGTAGRWVRAEHGRNIRPHLAIAAAYSQIAVVSGSIRVGSSPEKRAQAEQAAARRRNGEHRPEATAKICVDHGRAWGRTAVVAKAFRVSKRQAARYIRDAKDAGYNMEEES